VVYEWSAAKAAANLKKHDVAFEDAATVFTDPLALTFRDPAHSWQERREITIGHTKEQRLVFVSHSARGDRIRIISARPATACERRQYEEGNSDSGR
jgi:uncharacterized protein